MQLLGVLGDLIASWFQKIVEFIAGFFAFIPMTVYFIYTSICSLLDMFQYLIRKLAGLDVYYIDGVEQQGDLLVSFVKGILGIGDGSANYSTLSTVFWSLIIFSVILLVLTTIIAIIKAHYNYDSKKSQPMAIISNSIKAIFTMVLVPIVTVFGLMMSEIVLRYLDELTSASSGTNITTLYGSHANELKKVGQTRDGLPLYASFDCFGFGGATSTTTFSGTMFKIAAYDCNRVRTGSFSTKSSSNGSWQDFNLFLGNSREEIGNKIDEAFASRLTVNTPRTCGTGGGDSWILLSAYLVGGGAAFGLGLINVSTFSKYNVGLVYYYYNLWTYNYFLGFAGMAACFTLMINIVFGLMTRLIQCLALFLIYSPMIGIIPLDGGNAYKNWKKEFISNILMAYGAVIGMNLFFLILPFLYEISFFNSLILDRIMSMLFIIAGLSLIKKFMKLLSGFIGAADANETGKDVAESVKSVGMKAGVATLGAVGVGVGAGVLMAKGYKAMGKGVGRLGTKIFGTKEERIKKKEDKVLNKALEMGGEEGNKYLDDWAKKQEKRAARKEKMKAAGGTAKKVLKVTGLTLAGAGAVLALGPLAIGVLSKKGTKKVQQPVYKTDKDGKVMKDEKGQPIIMKDKDNKDMYVEKEEVDKLAGFKALGKGLLDMTGSTMKLAGDITGISSLLKAFGEAGGIDKAKETAVKFGQGIGKIETGEDGKAKNIPKWLQTKAQGEAEEKEALKKQQEAVTKMSAIQEETLKKIKELTSKLDGKSK